MVVLGTIVNTISVIAGSVLGLLLKKNLPKNIIEALPAILGLFTLSLGIDMALKSQKIISLLLSLILGAATGSAFKIQDRLEAWANRLSRGDSNFVNGLTSAFLTFCVGPMTIIGSLRDGMGDPSIILAKSIMDGIASIALASSLGIGVLFSALPLFVFQGSLAILGHYAGVVLPETILAEVTATGGVLLLGVGINLLELRKIKVGDGLPSLLYAAVIPYLLPF
ncbi:MAG: DUF554 domain-containing protein [Infirmifilum sp.]